MVEDHGKPTRTVDAVASPGSNGTVVHDFKYIKVYSCIGWRARFPVAPLESSPDPELRLTLCFRRSSQKPQSGLVAALAGGCKIDDVVKLHVLKPEYKLHL